MFFNVLFGILYIGAILAAGLGCFGLFNVPLFDRRVGILTHVAVWLASVATLAGLITIAISNQWGPFNPDGCSRARPCVQVEVQQ